MPVLICVLGTTRSWLVGQDGPVDRRKFMAATAGAGLGAVAAPALDLLASLSHAPVPAEVTPADIEQVRASARLFTSWDHTYGGAVARAGPTPSLLWSGPTG